MSRARVRLADPRRPRILLGINTGTSADAVDLALVRVTGAGRARTVEALAGGEAAMPEALRRSLHASDSWDVAAAARFHYAMGEFLGRCGRTFLDEAGWPAEEVTAAASHGQTVFHHDGDPTHGTLQIGALPVIARTLGVDVVGDFRWADLAAGGQGAPVSAFADWVLHGTPERSAAVLNLGGIANLTLLRGKEPPLAWDAGPANAPLDALMVAERGEPCDRDGRLSARGVVRAELLGALQEDAWFARPLPRSTGLERFGAGYAAALRARAPDAPLEDLLATLAELCAWACADGLRRAGWDGGPVHLCGGGAHNPALREALARHLAGARLHDYEELGWSGDRREAVAFALLGDAFLLGEPATWPSTTGARDASVLGQWCPAPAASGPGDPDGARSI